MSDVLYIRRGDDFFMRSGLPAEHKELPPGTYSVSAHPDHGLFLSLIDDISAPGKLYGSVEKRADRLIKSFLARPGITTGALLTGTKGTGKTLLAKRTIERARTHHKIPTIVVSAPFGGPGFLQFMNAITQPCIVFIDEVEKVYDEPEKQNSLLQLLDGAYSSHKLFILIANKNTLIDTLQNRPGRLHYRWSYNRLEREVVQAYAQDNLKRKDHMSSLLRMMDQVTFSTFDVLKGLTWEMNQYSETAEEAIENLNIDFTTHQLHHVTVKGIAGSPFAGREWSTQGCSMDREGKLKVSLAVFDYRNITEEEVAVYNRLHAIMDGPVGEGRGRRFEPTVETFRSIAVVSDGVPVPTHAEEQVRDQMSAEQLAVLRRLSERVEFWLGDEELANEDYILGERVYHHGDFVVEVYVQPTPMPVEDGPQPMAGGFLGNAGATPFGSGQPYPGSPFRPLPGAAAARPKEGPGAGFLTSRFGK